MSEPIKVTDDTFETDVSEIRSAGSGGFLGRMVRPVQTNLPAGG